MQYGANDVESDDDKSKKVETILGGASTEIDELHALFTPSID